MKKFRILEDSAPFFLEIKQSVQENNSSEQQPFHWGPRFHIGCRGLGRILSNLLWQWNEKAKGKSVRNNTVQIHS